MRKCLWVMFVLLFPVMVFGTGSVVQENYRWRNDDGSESAATWSADTNTPIAGVTRGENIRLRFSVRETLGRATSMASSLQCATSASGPWILLGTDDSTPFKMTATSHYNMDDPTTAQLGAGTFFAGKCVASPGTLASASIPASNYSNFEYCFQATAKAQGSTTYYFQLFGMNTYTRNAQLTMAAGEAEEPPNIMSSLAVDASVVAEFIYVIQASGSEPIIYSATNLPAGLTFDGTNTINGTSATNGVFNVDLTATSTYGADAETLVITVYANQPPIADDQAESVVEAGEILIYFAWSDPDTPLLADQTFTIETQPVNGTLESYNQRNGQTAYPDRYYYRADAGATSDSFTWKCNDGNSDSRVAACTVTITANTAPIANNGSRSMNSQTRTVCSLSVTDQDAGQIRTYEHMSGPAHGTLESFTSSATWYYTSDPGYVGSDSFTWKCNDGVEDSNVATYSITVNASAPVPQYQKQCVLPDTPTNFPALYTGGGGYTCTPVVVSGPLHGSVTVSNETFHYVPDSGYEGSDSFTWKMTYDTNETATATCTLIIKDSDGSDWPQWRCDAMRTGMTTHELPEQLYLQWRRDKRVLTHAWTRGSYMKFDGRYEPIVMGQTLFVASTGTGGNDGLDALDTASGALKWRFYADGPVRFAPVAKDGRVLFVSDDGYLYCLHAADGRLAWKFRGRPTARKVFGNERMISNWPARGGPVYRDGKVYFACGLYPQDGVFAYCLDVTTGSVIWRNDSLSGIVDTMDHDNFTKVPAGPAPQGYLTISENLYLAASRANPAMLSLSTGKLLYYVQGNRFSSGPRYKGWWVDADGVSSYSNPGTSIIAGSRSYSSSSATALGVSGTVAAMVAADNKLFVTTTQGSLYCFGGAEVTPDIYLYTNAPLPEIDDSWKTLATQILTETGNTEGCAYVLGLGTGRLAEELVKQTTLLHVVAIDPDPEKVAAFRAKMDEAGLYGVRCAALAGDPLSVGLAPYTGRLIVSEDLGSSGFSTGAPFVESMFETTRPYGGAMWLITSEAEHSDFSGWISSAGLSNAVLTRVDAAYSVLTRAGALPGAVNCMGNSYNAPDTKVKAPLGMQWFGDKYVSGYGHGASICPDRVDGKMRSTITQDIYTGLPLSYEARIGGSGGQSSFGSRTNTFYQVEEPRSIYSGYGCGSGPRNYGKMATDRSGAAGFYDLQTDSGTVHLTAVRSGCNGSETVAPGNGVLLVLGGGCGCNYPLTPSTFALVHRPEVENWAMYGSDRSLRAVEDQAVVRLGVNFGAPGERRDDHGNMWLHRPQRQSVTPPFPVELQGTNVTWSYHHASRIQGGTDKPWVTGSNVRGMTNLMVGLTPECVVAQHCAQAPVIDGDFTDACWDGAYSVYMLETRGKNNSPASEAPLPMDVLLRYDSTNLYVGCRRRAPSAVNWAQFTDATGVWRLFISDSTNTSSRYVHFDCFAEGTLVDYMMSPASNREDSAWTDDWTCALQAGVSTSFVAEFAIPWATFSGAGLDTNNLVFDITAPTWFRGPYRYFRQSGGGTGNLNLSCPYDLRLRHSRWAPISRDVPYGEMNDTRAYMVRLYFAETEGAEAGQRIMDVKIQGETVLSNLDVYTTAGGADRALVYEFSGIQAKTSLSVDLVPVVGDTLICGVEVVPDKGATAPQIISSLEATAEVGVPFSYAITASGTHPIGFDASGLPAGLVFDGANGISGVPVVVGTNAVSVTATNIAGSDTEALTLTVINLDYDVDGIPDALDPDDDNDEMPDLWEVVHSLNPKDAGDAALDTDGDGLSNLQEYIAGTQPRDKNSTLEIVNWSREGQEIFLQVLSQTGRVYGLIRNGSLLGSNQWIVLTNGLPGTGGYIEFRDPITGAKKFYRIKVKLP